MIKLVPWQPNYSKFRNPYFYEEVKIELPPYLSNSHHLLFKFYHIVCQNPKATDKQKTDKEQLIGATWLPLRMRGEVGAALSLLSSYYRLSSVQLACTWSIIWLILITAAFRQDCRSLNDDVLALALGEHRLPVCTDLPKKEAYSCISPKVQSFNTYSCISPKV